MYFYIFTTYHSLSLLSNKYLISFQIILSQIEIDQFDSQLETKLQDTQISIQSTETICEDMREDKLQIPTKQGPLIRFASCLMRF